MLDAIKDVDGVIIRSDILDKEVFDAAKNLKIAVRAGAGYDNVDLQAATDKGVCVMNTPGQNSNAVAELAFGMMVMVARNFYNGTSGTELKGKKIGIHAYGQVGRNVARIAKGFGMEVYAFDPYCPDDVMKEQGVIPVHSAEELYATCQYVSLHVPATDETKKSINLSLLSKMPQGATLVNTARKEVINEDDIVTMFETRPDFRYISDIAPANAADIINAAAKVHLLMNKCAFISQSSRQAFKSRCKRMYRHVSPQPCSHAHVYVPCIIFSHKSQIPVESRTESHSSEHPVPQPASVARVSQIPRAYANLVVSQIEMFCQHPEIPLIVILSQVGKRIMRTHGQSRYIFPFLQQSHPYRQRPVLLVEFRFHCHISRFQQGFPVSQFQKREQRNPCEIVSCVVSERYQSLRQIVSTEQECSRFVHLRRRSVHHSRIPHSILRPSCSCAYCQENCYDRVSYNFSFFQWHN